MKMKKSIALFMFLALLLSGSRIVDAASGPTAKVYYVSPMGKDTNDGSIKKPFLTISKAVEQLSPGDIVYLREGSYHEEVQLKGVKGTVDKPIVIRPYQEEKVIIDGTIEIKDLEWEKHPEYDNVWQAKIKEDIWQLFVDDRMMINARWPNAEHPFENEERSSWWSRGKSWRHVQYKIDNKVVSGFDFERAKGFLVDDGAGEPLVDLPESAEGLMGVLNVNSMTTLVGRISQHEAGSAYFEYDVNEELQAQVRDPRQNNLRRILTKNASHAYYYFEGWAGLIDTPDEWAYDKNTGLLYLYSVDGKDLKDRNIRGKVQTTAFLLDDCENISIQGLHFYATCVQAYDCKRFKLEDNIFDYPSYSKRMLGSLEEIEVLTIEGSFKMPDQAGEVGPEQGTQNVFRNNIVRYSDGRGLHVGGGAYDVVDNNFFKYIDISGTPGGSVGIWTTGWRNIFRRNTLEVCSSSKATKGGDAGLVALNRISKFGYLQDDGTAIQGGGKGQQGTIFTQNWVHDSPKSGLRFDGDEGVNAYDRQTLNGSMVRNVVFNNNGGLMVKGDDHRVYNNTVYNTDNDAYKILTSKESEHSNHITITRNNIGDFVNASRRDDPMENFPIGPTDHNWVNKYPQRDIREILRDPDNLDFRPRKDATEIIDQGVDIPEELLWCGVTLPDFTSDFKVGDAPDIGAYEYGSKNYWIAGFQDVKATTPIPPDGTTTAKTDADLMWLPARNSELYRVYLGTSAEELKLLTEQDNNIAAPGILDPAETYFWRVDCKTDKGWSTGDVWKFQARGVPFDKRMSLPSSYVENFDEAFDFDRDNLDQNEKGLIMPWIRPVYNGDLLEIRDGGMWIEPSVDRRNVFEPIEIPNINVDLELYPGFSFSYKTTGREEAFGLFAGFFVPGGKGTSRSVFPETPLIMLQPSPDGFTTVRIELDQLVKQAKEEYGNSVAKSFLLQFYGPEDVQWQRKDGGIFIKDFQIGFASFLQDVSSISINGQRNTLQSAGEGVRINHNMFEIEIRLKGNEKVYTYPVSDPLPGNWNLVIQPGDNYRVIDGDIVKPDKNFKGKLKVRAIIETEGISSNSFDFEISVLPEKKKMKGE